MSVRAIQPASPTIGHHLAKPQQTLLDPYFMRACMGIMNLWFRTDVYGQYTGISQQGGVEVLPVLKAVPLLCCSRSLVLVGSTRCLSLQMENKQQASSLRAYLAGFPQDHTVHTSLCTHTVPGIALDLLHMYACTIHTVTHPLPLPTHPSTHTHMHPPPTHTTQWRDPLLQLTNEELNQLPAGFTKVMLSLHYTDL